MKSRFLASIIALIMGSIILISSYDEVGHKRYGRFSMFGNPPANCEDKTMEGEK